MFAGRLSLQWKTLACAALASAIVALPVLDSPSSTAAASEPASEVHLTVSVGTSGSSAVTALAPGDTLVRTLDVGLSPRLGAKVGVTVSVVGRSSLLDSDATNGLRVSVARCAAGAGWRRAGNSYVCPGLVAAVLPSDFVARVKDRHLALSTLQTGRTEHLLITFRLPSSAGNAFERLVSSVRLTFVPRA